jgi:predicted MPP superfamily phosphohydrolase
VNMKEKGICSRCLFKGVLLCVALSVSGLVSASVRTDSITSPASISRTVEKLSEDEYVEINRVVKYSFTHPDVPKAFDGCRIALISDTHYKSLFDERGLPSLTRLLRELKPDILVMTGDYQEGCEYVQELFDSIAAVKPQLGTYAVLGNNDYERCTDEIRQSMASHHFHLLEQKCDTVVLNHQRLIFAGIENSTATDEATVAKIRHCPTLSLKSSDFVILLTHTPDYAELYDIAHTDLALAGHTHGGQVVIFGHAPKVPSQFGERFLTGLKYTSAGVPMIITNGIGTSQLPIRIGAPAEVVLITLHAQ